jgi:uncharacterized protein
LNRSTAINAARASFLALLLCWAVAAFADVAVPPLVGRVVDQTATLSSDDLASLNQLLRDFEARKGSQVAVLIVPTTNPESIEQYSIRVAEVWKIGRKKIDDGVVLVVAKNDRKLRIEVGYGLEGALTDVTAKRIIDEYITPQFRSGDFSGGISAGVNQILRVVTGEKLPAPDPVQQRSSSWAGAMSEINPGFAMFGLVVMAAILRATLGRLIGAGVTGSVVGLLAWLVAGSLLASFVAAIIVFLVALVFDLSSPQGRSSGGGGWDSSSSSGGSWGGSSGSSDSSSSSDSGGGGGSFGGGGASGSW